MKRFIRVGNAQAFWGDRGDAAIELLTLEPDLDYLTMDYLAEVSMSILAIQRERDPSVGYARDFVGVVRSLANYWNRGGKCKLIVNAGGLNPRGCAQACAEALEEAGCRAMRIGVVQGDDVLTALRCDSKHPNYRNLDSGSELGQVLDRLITANAYLGADGIVQALKQGAEIVITGRVADPSLVLAPCIHEFGWSSDDWDRLAGGTVAGHLIECGTHVTGGISTDWLDVPKNGHIGFPIVEIHTDGSCVATKPSRSGGRVDRGTVTEQLIYEIGDPSNYMSPDVQVSFLDLELSSEGPDRVRVRGAKGRPKPNTYKVSATYRDGFRAAGQLTIFGPDAVRKAKRCGEVVLQRLADYGCHYRDVVVECLGSGDCVPVLDESLQNSAAYETVLRIAVEASEREPVERFTKEMIPLVTAGPQGTTGYAEGRPSIHSIFRYWPCLIDVSLAPYNVDLLTSANKEDKSQLPNKDALLSLKPLDDSSNTEASASQRDHLPENSTVATMLRGRLGELAFGRSGDKGTGANIGIAVRNSDHFEWLKEWLTTDRVREYFSPLGVESVIRYELPKLHAVNFVVKGILARGLRTDAQGKALAQALLAIPLDASRPSTRS